MNIQDTDHLGADAEQMPGVVYDAPKQNRLFRVLPATLLSVLFLSMIGLLPATQLMAVSANLEVIQTQADGTGAATSTVQTEVSTPDANASPSSNVSEDTEGTAATEQSNSSSARVEINGSSTSVSITSSARSSGSDSAGTTDPKIIIDGQEITPSRSGRTYTRYQDENSDTRIRTRIKTDSDSSTSITISTNDHVETEAD